MTYRLIPPSHAGTSQVTLDKDTPDYTPAPRRMPRKPGMPTFGEVLANRERYPATPREQEAVDGLRAAIHDLAEVAREYERLTLDAANDFVEAAHQASMTVSAALTPRVARTRADAESLRLVRNTCADFMTGSTRQLDAAEQVAWWDSEARRGMAIWLFDAPDGQAVGFGLLRMVGYRWWGTLGLLPDWRGQGHGTAIYRHLIAHCPGDLAIDVLLTNAASARAAERAGFRLTDWNGATATLVARRGAR